MLRYHLEYSTRLEEVSATTQLCICSLLWTMNDGNWTKQTRLRNQCHIGQDDFNAITEYWKSGCSIFSFTCIFLWTSRTCLRRFLKLFSWSGLKPRLSSSSSSSSLMAIPYAHLQKSILKLSHYFGIMVLGRFFFYRLYLKLSPRLISFIAPPGSVVFNFMPSDSSWRDQDT